MLNSNYYNYRGLIIPVYRVLLPFGSLNSAKATFFRILLIQSFYHLLNDLSIDSDSS